MSNVPSSLAGLFGPPPTATSPPSTEPTALTDSTRSLTAQADGMNTGKSYGYQQTIFGSYQTDLAARARAALAKKKKQDAAKKEAEQTEAEPYKPTTYWERVVYQLGILQDFIAERELMVIFLVLSGLVSACIAVSMDIVVSFLWSGRSYIASMVTNFWLGLLVWVLHTLVLLGLALYFTHTIAPNAVGSGIPEMKCILSGLTLSKYLSRKTLTAKLLGLVCGLGSGRQGPFVHVASSVVNLMSRLRIFKNFASQTSLKNQLLASACAVGVSVSYGAPIGGVLYSIEVTSTYYPIRHYWAAFIASITSGFAFRAIWNIFVGSSYLLPMVPTTLTSSANLYMTPNEWFMLVLMAITGSVLGVIFIKLNAKLVNFRRKYASQYWILGPFPYTVLVGILTATCLFPKMFGGYMSLPNGAVMKDMFADRTLVGYSNINADWTPYSVFLSLFLFFTVRVCHSTSRLGSPQFLLGVLASTAAIPIGTFAPCLALGAVLGRFFGELCAALWPGQTAPAAAYAIIGTAAFAGSITQTISTAIILLEYTGDISFLCPALVVIVISVGVSRKLSVNIYDSMLIIRRLPFLPDLRRKSYALTAKDFMRKDVPCLSLDTSLNEMKQLFETYVSRGQNFRNINIPIVDDKERRIFIGSTKFEQFYIFYNKLRAEFVRDYMMDGEESRLDILDEEADLTPEIMNMEVDLRPRMKELLYGNPIQVVPDTPVSTIHIMFVTLHLYNVFVVKHGRLQGVITRSGLKRALKTA